MTDNLAVILVTLAAFVVIGTGWWILTVLFPLTRDTLFHRRWAIIGIQVNVLLILFAFMVRPSGLFWGVLAPWYPPLAMVTVGREGFLNVVQVLGIPLIAGLMVAGAVFVLAYFYKALRVFAIGLAGAAGLAVTALQAPSYAAAKIEEVARERGATCLAQQSLWQSRTFAGDLPQYNLHAVARIDGRWYGWSYSEGDFYALPERVHVNDIPLINDCEPLG